MDRRVEAALAKLAGDPKAAHSPRSLAALVSLWPRQLRRLFKQEVGTPLGAFARTSRMELARACLTPRSSAVTRCVSSLDSVFAPLGRRIELLPIMGNRTAVNAQNDSQAAQTSGSEVCGLCVNPGKSRGPEETRSALLFPVLSEINAAELSDAQQAAYVWLVTAAFWDRLQKQVDPERLLPLDGEEVSENLQSSPAKLMTPRGPG